MTTTHKMTRQRQRLWILSLALGLLSACERAGDSQSLGTAEPMLRAAEIEWPSGGLERTVEIFSRDAATGASIPRVRLNCVVRAPGNPEQWSAIVLAAKEASELHSALANYYSIKVYSTTESDAAGRATITIPSWSCSIEAFAGGLYGRTTIFEGDSSNIVIDLYPDESAAIAVVDPQWKGVEGAPVYLRQYIPSSESEAVAARQLPTSGQWSTIWQGLTDAEGTARVEHVQEVLRYYPGNGEPLQAALGLPGMEEVCVDVVPDKLPGQRLVLSMPPHASLNVSLKHSGSGPVPLGSAVALDQIRTQFITEPRPDHNRLPRPLYIQLADNGGVATFSRVAIGASFHFVAVVDNEPRAEALIEELDPARQGGELVLDIGNLR